MKNVKKVILPILLIVISVGLKIYNTYELYYNKVIIDRTLLKISPISIEGTIYFIDLLAICCIFWLLCSRLKRTISKILIAVPIILGYFASLLIFNYYWLWLETCIIYKINDGWTVFDEARSGIEIYLETGNPKYHLALIGVLLIFAAIIFWSNCKSGITTWIGERIAAKIAGNDEYDYEAYSEASQEEVSEDIQKGIYRHFKGGLYEVLGSSRHSETLEKLVVYRSLYGGGLWVRPIEMWNDITDWEDLRFTKVADTLEEYLGEVHCMRLYPESFEKIRAGEKTIELRLYDEKRHKVKEGDYIKLVSTEDTNNIIVAKVVKMHIFESFAELYKNLSLIKCGYSEESAISASPEDMNKYYSPIEQKLYGVVGIEIEI